MSDELKNLAEEAAEKYLRERGDPRTPLLRDQFLDAMQKAVAQYAKVPCDIIISKSECIAELRRKLKESLEKAFREAASVAWDSIAECAEDDHDTWKPDTHAHDVQEHVNNRIHEAIAAARKDDS